jgi:hypothetical protein
MKEKAKRLGIKNLTPFRRPFLIYNVILSQLVMKQYAVYGTSHFLFRPQEVFSRNIKVETLKIKK